MVLGENGIIAKAQRAKSATDEASAKEAVELAVGYVQSEAYTNNLNQEGIRAALQEELQKTDANATVSINGDGYTATYKGYEFEIDSNFNVTIKQPFNAAEWDKTAAPETCFQWGSDNPEDGEAYHTIIGYTEELQTQVKIRIPSRCTKIQASDSYNSNYFNAGRSFIQNDKNIELPETIVEIGDATFADWKGSSIIIPNSVTSIGYGAFMNCINLIDITIPDSVTSIYDNAFRNTAWYNNQPDGLVYVGKVAYEYKGTMPSNTSIELKEGTKGIANTAFAGRTELTSITIPNSVTSIGSGAFSGCRGLTSVTIPNSVTSIGGSAFYNCTGLTSITIPDSVTSIEGLAFEQCRGLTSVTIPNSVTNIEGQAFSYCTGLTNITIPDSVTSIGSFAFSNCTGLTNITIPDSVTSIGYNVFYNTAWYNNQADGMIYINNIAYTYKGTMPSNTSIELKEGTRLIASAAFQYNCKGLTSITIPDSVTIIGENAFYECTNLTSVAMSRNVKKIETGAFGYCTSLQEIVIWKNVDELGYRTFENWTGSQTVNIEASEVPAGWDSNWNYGCNANIVYGYTGN